MPCCRRAGCAARRCTTAISAVSLGTRSAKEKDTMSEISKVAAFLLVLLVAACASPQSPTPTVKVPDTLKPGADESLAMIVPAKGVQIYECRARRDSGGGYEWAFVAPEADLFDARGNRIGRHYAGPHWESTDGSKIVGTLKERADAPVPGCSQAAVGTTARIYYAADYYFLTSE